MPDIDSLPPEPELTWVPAQMAYIISIVREESAKQICNLSASCIAADLDHLRPGVRFTIIYPKDMRKLVALATRSHKNFHIRIDFVDGIQWWLRVRCHIPLPEFETEMERSDYECNAPPHPRVGVESEVLSLKAMRDAGVTLVPNAYLPKKDADITPGKSPTYSSVTKLTCLLEYPSAHFYCDFLPGFPVDRLFDIRTGKHQVEFDELVSSFIDSYADYQIALSKLRFDSIGQLEFSRDGEPIMGPIRDPDDPLAIHRRGTCRSLGEFHMDRIQGLLQIWADKKEEWGDEGRREYLTLLECQRWLSESTWLLKKRTDFNLIHPNMTKEDFLVGGDGVLSGVVNWHGVYSTIKEQAFVAPPMFRIEDDCDLTIANILDGDLSENETLLRDAYISRGRHDLAGCVEGGKLYRVLWQIPRTLEDLKRYKEHLRIEDQEVFPPTMEEWIHTLATGRYKYNTGFSSDVDKVFVRLYCPGW